jgi:serine/threonine-protein kinase
MAFEEERHLVSQAVARGFLSPPQGNQVLRALRDAETAKQPFSARDYVLGKRMLAPKRWDEFLRQLRAPAKPAPTPTPAAPPPAVAPEDADLPLPFEIGGFRLLQKIGQGGMGAVYKALQIQMRRHVAIKILPRKSAVDRLFVEQFYREARAAAALNHPNVVLPIDVGEARGFHYLAMEFVDGESLGAWMEREGRLRWREAVEIAIQVAKGLTHAHENRIIHRDIKPDNILLDRPSRLAKIADLGLAKRAGARPEHTISRGHPVGTAYYVSPEQARGQADLDGRADLYSLGATLWHMLVGVPPFDGPNIAVIMTKHITEPMPDPRTAVTDCPEGLVWVLHHMMAKDRTDRYPDCPALCKDLECLLAGKRPVYAQPVRVGPRVAIGAGVARAGPGGTRLRDPAGSRMRDPTRPRDPAASRLRAGAGGSRYPRDRAQEAPGPFRRRSPLSLYFFIFGGIVAVLVALAAAAIFFLQNSGETTPEENVKPAPRAR